MTGLCLVLIAFILMIVEAHVASFGVLGAASIITLLVGGKIIVDQGGLYGIPLDWPMFLGIAAAMMVTLVLASNIVLKSLKKPGIAGPEAMIGEDAKIVDWSGHTGHVMIHGAIWQAHSAQPHSFNEGDVVTVSAINELVLHIRLKD